MTCGKKERALQAQIDAPVEDAIRRARFRLPQGESLEFCALCGSRIPEARRRALQGVRLCVSCQQKRDPRH